MTRSALYAGHVVHDRARPRRHRLRYRIFMLLLDLDEIDALDARLKRFSRGRFNLIGFHDRDHLDDPAGVLKDEVLAKLRSRGLTAARVSVLAMPRILGKGFISGPLVGLWLAVFSLPLFLFTPDRPSHRLPAAEAVRRGLGQLKDTFAHIGRYRQIGRFLIARMIYTDGLNTLFAFGGIYAAGTFGMGMAEVIRFGILLNVTAGLGALAFGWIDDWLGAKRTILIALLGLLAGGIAAVLVTEPLHFWIAGAVLGVFVGPTQAASRSLMSRMAPPALRTQMFGLYALTGKITAYLGPFALGTVTWWTGSQRLGIATILVFFVVGMYLLWPLNEPQAGNAEAG